MAVVPTALAVSADQYDEVGGFRDVPVRGVEDIEFGYRLQNNGAVLIPDRQARHWHQGVRTMSGDRIEAMRAERQPYVERLLPVGGFRRAAPEPDGPVEVVPQLLVHLTDTDTPVDVLTGRAAHIRNCSGTNVEVRLGVPDDRFEPAFAQLAMPSSIGWGPDTADAIMAALLDRNVGVLLLIGDSADPVIEVIRTRAVRRSRGSGSGDGGDPRRLFGVSTVGWDEVRIGPAAQQPRPVKQRLHGGARATSSLLRRVLRRLGR